MSQDTRDRLPCSQSEILTLELTIPQVVPGGLLPERRAARARKNGNPADAIAIVSHAQWAGDRADAEAVAGAAGGGHLAFPIIPVGIGKRDHLVADQVLQHAFRVVDLAGQFLVGQPWEVAVVQAVGADLDAPAGVARTCASFINGISCSPSAMSQALLRRLRSPSTNTTAGASCSSSSGKSCSWLSW